jgi:hypothetical protein
MEVPEPPTSGSGAGGAGARPWPCRFPCLRREAGEPGGSGACHRGKLPNWGSDVPTWTWEVLDPGMGGSRPSTGRVPNLPLSFLDDSVSVGGESAPTEGMLACTGGSGDTDELWERHTGSGHCRVSAGPWRRDHALSWRRRNSVVSHCRGHLYSRGRARGSSTQSAPRLRPEHALEPSVAEEPPSART